MINTNNMLLNQQLLYNNNNLMNNNFNFANMQANQNKYNNKPLYPHRTGLMNINQTCYMNATIQCLSNISDLSNKLLKAYGTFDRNKQPLIYEYSNLLFELFYSNKKYVIPSSFRSTVAKLNPLFEENKASDAKDLIFFLIERFHQELKPPDPPKNENDQNNPVDFYKLELESLDEQLTFQKFIKELKEKDRSIISEKFNGITRSTMECFGCNKVKYSFQTFNIFNFILKKVKDDKISSLGEYYDYIDIYDAFDSDKKEQLLFDENMIHCNFCKGLQAGKHQQLIYGLPSVLIITLNRGKGKKDFNEEFKFYETLDFTKSNYIIEKNSFHRFYLCGIVTHLGESGSSGHFIAYCRANINSKFTFYNDTVVSEATVEEAMKTVISYNDYEQKTPYILFYHYY